VVKDTVMEALAFFSNESMLQLGEGPRVYRSACGNTVSGPLPCNGGGI